MAKTWWRCTGMQHCAALHSCGSIEYDRLEAHFFLFGVLQRGWLPLCMGRVQALPHHSSFLRGWGV